MVQEEFWSQKIWICCKISDLNQGEIMESLYFEPEVVQDFIKRLRQDKLRKSDISLIADIVRMMTHLNLSYSKPGRSIAALEDFLEIDEKSAKELLELTKPRPLPVTEEGKSYSVSYEPDLE
jgi:hypothetical protein